MPCQGMHTWSLSGLVGAFVDLSIAYFLLCASAIAFMASKFLEVFGLCLPCPCDGLFVVQPNRNLCFQKLFIDYPAEKVSSVQLSVRSKFPFNDSMWRKDQNCNLNLRFIGKKDRDVTEVEGEASYSSISDARNEVGSMKFLGTKEGRFDMKGKEIMHQRPRSGLRRRRKGASDHGKYLSIASYDPRFSEVQGDPESPHSVNKGGNELTEDDRTVLHNEIIDSHHDHEEASMIMRLGQKHSNSVKFDEVPLEDVTIEKNVYSLIESNGNAQAGSSRDDKYTIRLLEQALEEEQAARTALYLELDKERSAAASAADEAMAMIQRLQEEKASIEMEARQYQRIIEEKSAYDAEEMNILKEIIIRREREKHFLEKEVEAYRQIIHLGNEQSTENSGNVLGIQSVDSSLDPTDDPVLMLQQLSTSIDEKKDAIGASKESSVKGWDKNAAFHKQGHPIGHLREFSVGSNVDNQELQDKMVPIDKNSSAPPGSMTSVETLTWSCKVGSPLEKFPVENISLVGKGKEHVNKDAEMSERNVETSHTPSSLDQSEKDENKINRGKEEWMPRNRPLEIHMTKDVSCEAPILQRSSAVRDSPNSSNSDAGVDINKSSYDMHSRLPPIGPKGKSLPSMLRRNSMSALDNERFKIDCEIGWLRERLRIVQEGRGKLNLSVEHRERDKLQLKLLEDIAFQLQEIRQLTEPRVAIRQASLPVPSSKVISRKRRCRSASLGR